MLVPIYNVELYLFQCLESIRNQTYANIEIILVNDGSTDRSVSICREFTAKDSRFKLINQENKGDSNTRNRAIAKASGDYITFIDADDFVEPNYIEAMITVARDNDSDIVVALYNQFLQESQEYAWLHYPSSDMFQVDK